MFKKIVEIKIFGINQNITQQIHNTGCLERGKIAYKTLDREFNVLFEKLNKHEQ